METEIRTVEVIGMTPYPTVARTSAPSPESFCIDLSFRFETLQDGKLKKVLNQTLQKAYVQRLDSQILVLILVAKTLNKKSVMSNNHLCYGYDLIGNSLDTCTYIKLLCMFEHIV